MTPRPHYPVDPTDTWEDRAARVVETWEAWDAEPFDFFRTEALRDVMGEHVAALREQLAAAGWDAAKAREGEWVAR